MRVIGYARLSLASDESTSIARQKKIIRDTCSARGFDLIDLIVDEGVSATKTRLDRPGLDAARARIAAGEAEGIVCWRLDRLCRNVVDMGTLLDEGIEVISATEAIDTSTPMGRAMVKVIQIFAQMEAEVIGERVAMSVAHLRQNGRWPGGVAPYGYKPVDNPDGPGRVLELDPTEAAVLRRAADMILDGTPVLRVCNTLSDNGAPTRFGGRWSPRALKLALTSNAVLGRSTVNDEVVRGDDGLPVQFWEPVLPLSVVEALRAELAPKPAGQRRTKASRLLSGLLHCGSCSMRLVVNQSSGRKPFYRCPAPGRGLVCARGTSMLADRADTEVERQFMAAVGHLQVVEARRLQRDPVGLVEVEEALRDTTDAMRRPEADIAALAQQVTALQAERARLVALPATPTVEMIDKGETFAETWHAADTDGKRRLLQASGVEIRIAPGRAPAAERVKLAWAS